jgi:16S rRNA (guanine527-N7)-methyltransferase
MSSVGTIDVSRETIRRLEVFADELQRWQSVKNLVGRGTLSDIWQRHVEDSLQLAPLIAQNGRWLDLGSGAGFPGLVVAIARRDDGVRMTLVESNARKCAFLRHVARVTETPVTVLSDRVEAVVPGLAGTVDVVSARALAPLSTLLDWVEPLLKTGAKAVFPKGKDVHSELTEARKLWTFEPDILPSATDPDARILVISSIEPRS